MSETAKHAVDGVSIMASLGALLGLLPILAAFASLVWTLIRIYETKTVQDWIASIKAARK